ncbi:MAG: FTR1 family protein [Gammaproteobacteria bacterium]|nr:FTR1 family protein [Gammaproteobacteria bacterium]
MLGVALLVFREVLEAALVIGIVFAATQGVASRKRWIGVGLSAGIVGAIILALFAERLAAMAAGMGQELFNATVLFAAVAMLGWHTLWMARHGQEIVQLSRAVGANVTAGHQPLYALAIVVGLAVLREGSEVVLFLYGLVAAGNADAAGLLFGGAAGLAAGIGAGIAIARGLRIIPSRYLFTVTGWLIALLAAGMAAQGMAFLSQAGYISRFTETAWDTSAFATDRSLLGQALHAFVGYTAAPMVIQVMAYLATLLALSIAILRNRAPSSGTRTANTGLAIALAAIALSAMGMREAKAGFKVYSPYVEYREWEFEFRGNTSFDDVDAKDGAQGYLYELGYSPTTYWHTALFLKQEHAPGDFLRSTEFTWENVFQLTEPGQYWLDVGAYIEYAKGLRHGGDHAFEWKVLLEKSIGKWTFTTNPIFVQKFPEAGENPGVDFEYAWGTHYRLRPEFEPGFEAFGGVGELTHASALEEQEHLIGPDVRGRLVLGSRSKLRYNLGYLFGLTDAVPDGVFKFELEYEFRF